jgi:hypothetical protein
VTKLGMTVLDRGMLRLASIVIAISLGACTEVQQNNGGSSITEPSLVVAEQTPTPAGPTLDVIFEQIMQEVPGFAGMYIDAEGIPTIQLVDTTRHQVARTAVLQRFNEVAAVRERTARIIKVSYSFQQLKEWRDVLYQKIPAGVRLVDIDEKRNVLHVGAAMASDVGTIRSEGLRIGIPASALLVDVAPSIEPATAYLGSAVRPTMGGLLLAGTYHGCTLGFNVKKVGSTRYFATNAHCTGIFGAVDGSGFGQPLLQPNYYLGAEVADPAFVTGGSCPVSGGCRFADVALIQYDTSSVGDFYTIARTLFPYTGTDFNQSGSTELAAEPFYTVGELSDAALVSGAALSKVGATTGWTSGTVTSTCFDWYVTGTTMIRCQYTVSAVVHGGDSGSPVFSYELSTGKAWLAGILWGTTGTGFIFSPLSGVKSDLGAMTVSKPVF